MLSAVITGASGQDGTYLTKLLRQKGYHVYPWTRADGDIRHPSTQTALVNVRADEYYLLGALQDVEESRQKPSEYFEVNLVAPLKIMQLLKERHRSAKVFLPSSGRVMNPEYDDPYTS